MPPRGPTITTRSLESEGVFLLRSTSAAFQHALDPQRDREFDVLLPYSALLENHSGQNLIG